MTDASRAAWHRVFSLSVSATLTIKRLGEGQLADQFQPLADALRADGYDGVLSLESVYHPGNGDFEAGFHLCVDRFKSIFG